MIELALGILPAVLKGLARTFLFCGFQCHGVGYWISDNDMGQC